MIAETRRSVGRRGAGRFECQGQSTIAPGNQGSARRAHAGARNQAPTEKPEPPGPVVAGSFARDPE
jgi:hypothetical protein